MNGNNMASEQSESKPSASGVKINPADFAVTHFKTEVAKLTDTIMRYAAVYLRTRMFMRLFFRLQQVYDNNCPGWRNEPNSQSLLNKFESLNNQLKETKEIILVNKDLLMIIYEEFLASHEEITKQCGKAGEHDLEKKAVKDRIDELKKDVNCKMLHVVAAMELIMQINLPQ